jgi:hypothetical protein
MVELTLYAVEYRLINILSLWYNVLVFAAPMW